jgi:hypothetical protein
MDLLPPITRYPPMSVPVSDDTYNHVLSALLWDLRGWVRVFLEELPYVISTVVYLIATACGELSDMSGLAGLFAFGAALGVYAIVWIRDRQPPPPNGVAELDPRPLKWGWHV